jgi:formylglycine-generating enzyme required for sulfatase activity
VDFRGCGASGGRLVEDHLILDARAAVAFLHARGVERLVCIGASLGGTTCLRLAADAEIEGVAALSSLMSAGPTNQVTEQELPGLGMPSLFAYGNRDAPQVRMEMARMHRAAGLPKDLMVLDGAAHGAELLDAPQGEELRGRLLGLVAGIAAPPHVANLPTHPTATPHASGGEEGVPALGDSWVRPADGMLMVYVPGGTFLIGSSEDDPEAVPDELPQHPVTVDSFWIDQTEVTNGQFVQFLNAHGNSGERGAKMIVLDRGYTRITQEDTQFSAPEVTLDRPVLMVTWYGAAAYCEWAGGRLPREAEWEYAARGPDSNIYPWGNEPPTCELANYGDCTRAPVRVGSRPAGASWCGALDMAGNVWEWVTDWFAPYSGLPEENPAGPATGEVPVLRGGGWHSPRWELRTAYRQHEVATTGYNG